MADTRVHCHMEVKELEIETKRESEHLCLLIQCDRLWDHPLRLNFYNQSHLLQLTESISKNGLLEPLLVYEDTPDKLVILGGHYRIRAVRRLRQKTVLCRVLECDRKAATAIYCTANSMVRSLSAMEEAHITTGLLTDEGYTLEEAGRVFGRSASWACRRVKLLRFLSPALKSELQKGGIHPRTAQELTRLPQGNDQERVFSIIKGHRLSKEEAIFIVDRWLLADENIKSKIEDEYAKKNGSIKDTLRYITDPGKSLGACFRMCTLALLKLCSYLDGLKPPYNFWPWEEYKDFMNAVERVSIAYRYSSKSQ
jgi:ParB/RepB/Spo0J family partition protein